jgi:glycosyltransferase involved in cell wall biosynthesis
MKVVIFSTYFLPVVGGVQTYVKLLAQGLTQFANAHGGETIEVTVVTETSGSAAEDSRFPYRIVRKPRRKELWRLIRDCDVLHLAGPSLLPMALAWWMHRPFTIEQHGYQAICPNGLLFLQPQKSVCPGYFRERRYQRCIKCRSAEIGLAASLRSLLLTFPRLWLSNRAAANIAITDHVDKRLRLNRSCTIYYGVEDSPTGEIGSAPPCPEIASPIKIAYVGRLVAEKGLPLLLRAARQIKDDGLSFRLFFIGDGPERKPLADLATQLHVEDCVTFAGGLRDKDLAQAVRDVSIVVMPSIWEETAGLSAIEQMMRGGAVVAADIGGLSEVVGEAGLKFPPHDWEGLAACIRELAGSSQVRARLGAMAQRRAREKFSIDRMIREHAQVFEQSAARAARGH